MLGGGGADGGNNQFSIVLKFEHLIIEKEKETECEKKK